MSRHQPSQFRCLAGLLACAPLLLLAFVQSVVDSLRSFQGQQLQMFPAWLVNGALLVALGGVAWSAYRCYRDFYLGEYYLDREGDPSGRRWR